jgi:hypothetical protein
MKRIVDWSLAVAALLAAFVVVTINASDSQLLSIHGGAVTSRADWFAARGRDGMPVNTGADIRREEPDELLEARRQN